MNAELSPAFPKRTLAIPAALGLAIVGLVKFATPDLAEAMTPISMTILVLAFAAAVLVEAIALPTSLWRLVKNPQLRVSTNLLATAVAVLFVGIVMAQLLAHLL